jgi:predicted heme/steroid binding protein
MKTSRIILIIILVVIILVSAIAGYLLLRNSGSSQANQSKQSNDKQSSNSNQGQSQGIRLDEVAKHTGKDGNSCWVAVDGTVYEISGFVLWVEGEHKPSGGRAKCGKDLSEVIKQSPHGKSKLKLLKEIGPLQQ